MHKYLQNSARLRTPATNRPSLKNRRGKRRLLCTAFLALIAIGPLDEVRAQVYDFDPDAEILGKSQEEHSQDFINWLFASNGTVTHATTERLYENQRGPVFFLATRIGTSNNGATRETAIREEVIDVPYGAPIAYFDRAAYAWNKASNCNHARSLFDPGNNHYLFIDGEAVDVDLRQSTYESEFELVNRQPTINVPVGTTDVCALINMAFIEPLEPGQHVIETGDRRGGIDNATHHTINVFEPERASLNLGETYAQDFNSLGTDGETVKAALPSAWTVTDEWGFALQRDTDTAFPISTVPRPGAYPYVTNAGVPGEEDRSLSIMVPTNREISLESDFSRIQFEAEADSAANALQLDFAIEAWDASTLRQLSEPGEAAFHVTVEMDQGEGFEPLLDLGKVTTGVLTEPEEDYLNGNDEANRVVFNSGVLHANIPESAKLRFRWNADSGTHAGDPGDSDGWLFGIDDVGITLAAAGDTNFDGEVKFDDFLVLSANFGDEGGWAEGDFDGNGEVDFPDFLALSANFGGADPASAASVPEPTAASIALFGLLGLIGYRKRR